MPFMERPGTGPGQKKEERKMVKALKGIVMALGMTALVASATIAAVPTSNVKGAKAAQSASVHAKRTVRNHRKALPKGKISINRASVEQLQSLPRIGPKVARRIIDYRTAHKGFKTIEELRNVRGIGVRTMSKLRPYLSL